MIEKLFLHCRAINLKNDVSLPRLVDQQTKLQEVAINAEPPKNFTWFKGKRGGITLGRNLLTCTLYESNPCLHAALQLARGVNDRKGKQILSILVEVLTIYWKWSKTAGSAGRWSCNKTVQGWINFISPLISVCNYAEPHSRWSYTLETSYLKLT